MDGKTFNISITKPALPGTDAQTDPQSMPTTISVSTQDPDEVLKIMNLAGVSTAKVEPEETKVPAETPEVPMNVVPNIAPASPETLVNLAKSYDDVARDVPCDVPCDDICDCDDHNDQEDKEIVAAPGTLQANIPLIDAGDTEKDQDSSELFNYDVLKELGKLANIKSTDLEESYVLTEVDSSSSRITDFLHKVGAKMIDHVSKVTSFKGLKDNDPKFVRLNNMSRVGEMLVNLGEAFSTPISEFDRQDLEFIAQTIGVPYTDFMKKIGVKESIANLHPYQGKNVFQPMSKKNVMGDQPLVNNSGENSMVNPADDEKRLTMKTIKEALDDLYGRTYSVVEDEEVSPPEELSTEKKTEFSSDIPNEASFVDYDTIAQSVINLDDDSYFDVTEFLFGHADQNHEKSAEDISEMLGQINENDLEKICKTFLDMDKIPYAQPEGSEEVEEGNSHDDLRAAKSDHDTLMRKNIEDFKHGYPYTPIKESEEITLDNFDNLSEDTEKVWSKASPTDIKLPAIVYKLVIYAAKKLGFKVESDTIKDNTRTVELTRNDFDKISLSWSPDDSEWMHYYMRVWKGNTVAGSCKLSSIKSAKQFFNEDGIHSL